MADPIVLTAPSYDYALTLANLGIPDDGNDHLVTFYLSSDQAAHGKLFSGSFEVHYSAAPDGETFTVDSDSIKTGNYRFVADDATQASSFDYQYDGAARQTYTFDAIPVVHAPTASGYLPGTDTAATAGVFVAPAGLVTDSDDDNSVSTIAISLGNGADKGDTLDFMTHAVPGDHGGYISGVADGQILYTTFDSSNTPNQPVAIGSYTFDGTTLTFTRDTSVLGEDTTIASKVLQAVHFDTISTSPDTRTLTYVATDAHGATNATATETVRPNTPPVVDLDTTDGSTATGSTTTLVIGTDGNASDKPGYPGFDIAPHSAVSDDGANFNGGSLVVTTTASGQGAPSVDLEGELPGSGFRYVENGIVVDGGAQDGTLVATLTIDNSTNTFTWQFVSPLASASLVNALIRSFSTGVDHSTVGANADVAFALTDSDGATTTVHGLVTVVVNTPPVVDIDGAGTANAVTLAYTENGAATAIAPNLSISDMFAGHAATSLAGGNVTVAIINNVAVGDVLAFGDGVTLSQNATYVNAYDVAVNGIVIGTVAKGATTTLYVTLNASATTANVQALLDSVTYHSTSENPSTAARTVTYTVDDGQGGSTHIGTATATVNVTAVNDAPVLDIDGAGTANAVALSYTEHDAATKIAPALTVSDVDSANFSGGHAIVSLGTTAASGDVLSFGSGVTTTPHNGTTGLFDVSVGSTVIGTTTAVGGTAIDVTLNAAATPALVQTLVEAVSYSNISTSHPSTVDRTVSYSVSDGNGTDAGTGTATATIHVAIVDNAPTVLNPTPTINEDTATTFTVAQLATDKDGDALTITAATGTHGTVVIGADHQSLLFTPDKDYNGAASFTYTVSDGTKTTDGQTNLTVTPVNDAPVIDLNGGTVTDGINTVLSYTENEVGDRGGYAKVAPGALVSDVDNTTFPNGTLTVTLNNAQGADTLSSFSNDGSGLLYNSSTSQYYYDPSVTTVLSSYNFAANADKQITGPISSTGTSRTFTFTANATADAVRVLAEHIAFKNDSDNPATLPRDVTFVLTDGSGGTSATAHAAINVTAVNDAPVAIASAVTATEDASYTFKAADFQYTDAESNGLKSVTIVALPSAASGALTLHGTAVAANAIIAATDIGSLVYTPVHDQNGPVSFSFNVQDDGGTANQGVDTGVAAATLTINVGAVNDAPTVVGTTQAAATILEDMPSTAGQTVTALFGAHFSDAADAVTGGSTANAFAGVAITADGSTDAVGHWQYLAGGVWTNIPTVSDAKAFVLGATDQVRFNPAQDVNSGNAAIPTLTAHVVETGGAASGATVDLSTAGTTGGTSHYSTGTVVLSESVTPVNDAPVVNLQGAAFTYTENGPAHLVAPTATVVDVDSANFSGGTLTVSVAGGLAEDQLSIVSTITGISVNGTNVVYGAFSVGPIFGMPGTGFFNPGTTIGTVAGGTNGTPLVVTLNANATPAMTQALVDAIAYGDSSENPAKGAHNISFVLSDGAAGAGGATSLTQTASVTVMPVDDAPVAVADVATTNDTVAVHTTATSGGLLANDTDVDGPAVSIAQINGKAVVFDTAITLASGALLTVHADGSYDYDPNGKFEYLGAPGSGGQSVATDSFTYTLAGPAPTLSGGIGGTAATDLRTATATITLNGVDNNDTLSGITLTGASGHNDVNAGEGNNSITVTNATGTNTIETGAGNDTIHVTSTSGMTTISAGAGDDVVVAHGTGSFVINGGAGNDDLEAGSGNDRIYAGDGNDLVHGGSGAGNDFYDGGTGTDTLTYASTTLGVVVDMHAIDRSSNPDIRQVLDDAGQYTTDSMGARHYTPVGIAVGAESGTDAFINFENLTGGSGDDVLTGDDNANVIMGGAGNDTIMGGGGNDTLDGGTGINTLSYAGQTDAVQVNLASGQVNAGAQGGSDTVSNFQNVILGNGNDQFIGNDQNNVIEGGPGNDQIDGAGGYDTVIYRGIAPTDGMATQAFDQLRVNAGVLGTDTLTNVEEIDFVNATGTTVVKVVNGNAVVTEVADTGSVGQAGTLTVAAAGGVLANDINLDQGGTDLKTVIGVAHSVTTGTTTTTTTGTVGSAIVGDHGSLTLNADGSYVYVANDATKALAAGATYTDTFTYTAGDGDSGQSTPTTLTITITGTNDLPVVGGAVVGGVTEDVNVSTDGLHTIGTSGVLAISDTDTVPVSEAQFRPIPAVAGTYGTFTLAANGAWTYAADDTQTAIQQLGQGKTATDSFVATSYDGTTSEVVTVTITGTNDAPKLTAGTLATFTDSAATDAFTAISGKIAGIVPDTTAIGALADADVGDKYSYRVVDTTPNTTYGTFALDSTGHYTFTPDSAAINALKAPTSVTYTIEVNDGSGATNATSQATFTVQLNGANDTASFDPTSKFAGSVTEDVGVSTDGTHTIATSGTILVKDVDTGDAGTVAQTGNAGKYGVFAIDASGHWTYAADDSQAAIQALGKGETLTETFAVSSIDGTATQNVVVTINGTNDRPVLTGGSLGQIYDTAANDSFGNLSGQIANTTTNVIKLSTFAIAQPTGSVSPTGKVGTLADVDTNDKHSFTLAETTAQHTANDGYGTLSVASDGSYTFAPNNAAVNALAAGETKTLTYTVQVDDGSGVTGTGSDAATNTGDFTITLHGVNDTPVFGGSMTGNVKEDVNVQTTGGLFTSAVHTIGTSGLLTIADADHDQSVFQPTTTTDSFGTFAIGTNGAWTFTTNNDALAVQQLGEGATVTHTYNAVALDGTVQPVTITLTGTNDNPVFLAGTADDGQSLYARSVTESDAALALHGTLHTSDDVGDTDTFAYTASTDGHVSASGVTLTTDQVNAIKAAFAIDGSGNYSFNLPSPDYLDAGQVVTATFNVHAHDQLGADTVKAVTVTITGSEEVVTVDPNATTTTGGNYGDLIVVPAGAGDTIVYGLGGNDQITGGNGDDHLYGGAGDDTIYGGAGDNTLDGGSGNDKLYGGAGDDTLLGGSGDDLLSGGLGNNVIDGGSGTNTGVLQGVMSDYTITATANGGLLFTTGSGATLERDTFTNVQRFQFSDGLVYTPTGQFGPTFDVSATTAPYSLTTTTGRDTILVGATLTAGDHIDGNGGADQLVLSGDYTGAHALVLNDQTVTHIPTMVLAASTTDTPNAYDITAADGMVAAGTIMTVYGGLLASNESFTFDGSAEKDGAFKFFGGAGADTLTGGAGDDAFYFGPNTWDPTKDTVVGGGGTQNQLGLYGQYTTTLDHHAGVQTVVLFESTTSVANTYDVTVTDDFFAVGGAGKAITANSINGFVSTALTIDASAVTDSTHHLTIIGGTAGDMILGGAGDDLIFGGGGADTLLGGGGSDTFWYTAASQSSGTSFDTIDYQSGTDHIRIGSEIIDTRAGYHETDVTASGTYTSTGVLADDLAGAATAGGLSATNSVFFTETSGANQGQFMIVEGNGQAGYQEGSDYVFQIVPVQHADTTPHIMPVEPSPNLIA